MSLPRDLTREEIAKREEKNKEELVKNREKNQKDAVLWFCHLGVLFHEPRFYHNFFEKKLIERRQQDRGNGLR
jgi:hypothetical protein